MTTGTGPRRAPWFSSPDPSLDAEAQLFLFPHAGGTSLTYRMWAATVSSGIECRALQLPGRQERLDEPVFTRIEPLLAELQEALEAELDGRPYVVFGHSFGALLAYRLTVEIERNGGQGPELLGVSGWAPGLVASKELEGVADMTDQQILDRVAEFGLIPDEVPVSRDMLAAVMPSLRGDFVVAADYTEDGAAVSCPIAAYGGTSDPTLGTGALEAWAGLTPEFLGATEFPGDHFYLFEHALAVQNSLDRHLRRRLAARS
ncbi:alpha/beta fold hydrolase [Streptomyces triculaminicus]|uniref:thioesterase II family protein n=1 Tax=Streptomyces triculaminicus TaxID=2816232 RepID=UPI0033CDEB26